MEAEIKKNLPLPGMSPHAQLTDSVIFVTLDKVFTQSIPKPIWV
jgi:hypothetical protein